MSRARYESSGSLPDDPTPGLRGYARVSTDGQALGPQVEQLRSAGVGRVDRETTSGAKRDWAKPARLLRNVEPGDVALATRHDQLARSTRDLLNVLAPPSERGAAFRSLGDGWADTTTPHGRLMLTVLAGLAEFEREPIRARTGEGRARAKANGVRMGRPHELTAHQQREARERRDAGESITAIARSYNVDHARIGRLRGGQNAADGPGAAPKLRCPDAAEPPP